jgi:hypothetical protein
MVLVRSGKKNKTRRLFSDSELEPLPLSLDLQEAVQAMADCGIEERGAIFTKRPVVDFILDLCGFTPERDLCSMSVLEPSFGAGDFLFPIIERLLTSRDAFGRTVDELANCIRAVELHAATFHSTRSALAELLQSRGLTKKETSTLLASWLQQGDFLVTEWGSTKFDFVIGNPPYVRQERIAEVLLAEYRQRYTTLYDRADLYIPFIERCLSLLKARGQLAFICADRWMKNRYGGPLRQLIAEGFHFKAYVAMCHSEAFHTNVTAYPAITVIHNAPPGPTRIADGKGLTVSGLLSLSREMTSKKLKQSSAVREVHAVTNGSQPWIMEATDQLAVVRRLENDFPTLELAGCKVGIGVATGADKVFIDRYDDLDVEDDRKLPLAMTKDILDGTVQWQGLGVINPFESDGSLVDLRQYPRLAKYLNRHRDVISKRHVATKTPKNWYRTIDRITPSLAYKPKLLIPDIKGTANVVYEDGQLYPHHNLYFITSDEWDLRALQAVLMSGIAYRFVEAYTTKMRGGCLRFQAQYLRRIRIPFWKDVVPSLRKKLVAAAETGNYESTNRLVFDLYSLSETERASVAGNNERDCRP